MSYIAYKLVHLAGVFALLVALAGMAGHAASGRPKEEGGGYRLFLVLHGLGALLALVGGFGLLAVMGLHPPALPGWAWSKVVLWILLGALIAVPYRRRAWSLPLLLGLPVAALLGAYLGMFKPF